jgi:hypothetical protein
MKTLIGLILSIISLVGVHGQSLSQRAKTFACIRHYETLGHKNPYTTIGKNRYGAYQFSLSTWKSVGGSGNPANASPGEQDKRADLLQKKAGWKQWQTHNLCGV